MLKKVLHKLLGKKEFKSSGLELKINYQFKNKDHLNLALVHCSVANEQEERIVKYNNERMEFLGDSILNFLVTEYLYRQHPSLTEGEMSKMKSIIVSARVLAQCAHRIDLGTYILMSASEEKAGGRKRESILADAFEALLSALFLDSGMRQCKTLLMSVLFPDIEVILADVNLKNYKSILLEYTQGSGLGAPTYVVLSESGPEHEKEFFVEAQVQGSSIGQGKGLSKKRAEQEAARAALASIDSKKVIQSDGSVESSKK